MTLLKIIQLIHILNEIFLSTYVFIFPKIYDIYYTIFLIIIILHWIFLKNECILSYIEKKIIDKNYILGTNPYYHPYHMAVSKYFIYLFEIFKFINIFIVLYRNFNNKFIFISMLLIIGFYIFHFIIKLIKNNSSFSLLLQK
jgi:hypothetical protein